MINQDYFKGKDVTIIGLARSGFACAVLLNNLGARVSVTERSRDSKVMDYVGRLPGSINLELGGHSPEFIKNRDLIITSPGVEEVSQPLIWAKEFHIPVISEIECAWIICPAPVVAVTGTNGKTTTTTLIGRVLEAGGFTTHILGNIGTPFCAEVYNIKASDFVSLEVSSFQLETIKRFKPKISVILNISPDHLDRYKDLPSYLSAKSRIFMNQDGSDYLVLNRNDPVVFDLGKKSNAKVVYFDSGMHINSNFAATKAVASILGIDVGLCENVFQKFAGLPHRLERIAEFEGREFINDSKATNPDSTAFALRNINKPVILIAGGRDKGLDFSFVRELVSQKVKGLITIGEAKDKIKKIFQQNVPVKEARDLSEAVTLAFQQSERGDCILLSPMCASFDMFRDYEHRGEVFREAVGVLTGSSGK